MTNRATDCQIGMDAGDDSPPGLLALLLELDGRGLEVVRHGRFLGLRGRGVERVPAAVWAYLDRHEASLLRRLTPEPTPYQARRRGGSA
jgi:hypothetical protein